MLRSIRAVNIKVCNLSSSSVLIALTGAWGLESAIGVLVFVEERKPENKKR